jgi:serine/threonine protein kinase
MSAPTPPQPPRITGYVYRRSIGAGGSSYVYLFMEDTPYRPVAVKMPKTFGPDTELRERFVAEANAMARFGHEKHVVPVLAYREAVDGTPCLIMAHYEGGDLYSRVKAEGPLPVAEVLTVARQLTEAIAAAHRFGMLHQDVKPANVLIAEPGSSYRLGDFGIARLVRRHGPGTDAFSLSWASPEVVGGADATESSDIYSLGATLWHLLGGSAPFVIAGGDNSAAALKQRTVAGRPGPRLARRDAPDALASLLLRMLANQPAARPTAPQVLSELRRIETGLGAAPRPAEAPASGDIATTMVREQQNAAAASSQEPAYDDDDGRTVFRNRPPSPDFPSIFASTSGSATGPGGAYEPSDPVVADGQTIAAGTIVRAEQSPGLSKTQADPSRSTTTTTTTTTEKPAKRRRGLVMSLGALTAVLIGVAVATLSSGGAARGENANTPGATAPSAGDTPIDPGAAANGPPGPVSVTANRTDAAALHFSWTYSAAQATDTYQWRTPDGKHTGTARTPALDLADPAGRRLCVEIKVVRLDGSNADPDWSQPGCGQ